MSKPDLKLPRLPDRTPVKLTIMVLPELHNALEDYRKLHAEAYGKEEAIGDIIAAMLTAFLESDRGFAKARPTFSRHSSIER